MKSKLLRALFSISEQAVLAGSPILILHILGQNLTGTNLDYAAQAQAIFTVLSGVLSVQASSWLGTKFDPTLSSNGIGTTHLVAATGLISLTSILLSVILLLAQPITSPALITYIGTASCGSALQAILRTYLIHTNQFFLRILFILIACLGWIVAIATTTTIGIFHLGLITCSGVLVCLAWNLRPSSNLTANPLSQIASLLRHSLYTAPGYFSLWLAFVGCPSTILPLTGGQSLFQLRLCQSLTNIVSSTIASFDPHLFQEIRANRRRPSLILGAYAATAFLGSLALLTIVWLLRKLSLFSSIDVAFLAALSLSTTFLSMTKVLSVQRLIYVGSKANNAPYLLAALISAPLWLTLPPIGGHMWTAWAYTLTAAALLAIQAIFQKAQNK